MEKQLTLVVPGADDSAEARDGAIQPGMTAAAVLRAAGKDPEQWQLQLKRGESFVSLSASDVLYDRIESGEKAFVVPRDMVVGR